MKIRTLLTLLLSGLLLAAVAAAKKPTGKISDLAAFSRIHSYCVDSEDMPGDEIGDEVYQQLRFDLCPECRKKFIRNPLGRETAKAFGFSAN